MLAARVLLPFVLIAGAGALPVEMVTLKGGHKGCRYRIATPHTGQGRIDDELAAWTKRYARACDEAAAEPPVTTLKPRVVRNDDQLFAVSFEQSIESDTVHDTHERTTFNFLRPDGWRVFVPEIFEPTALPKISQLAIAALERRIDGDDLAMQLIADGAGPDWDNFGAFVFGPKTLDLYFASERVATYADGPQEIALPLAKLAPYFRKDWRAPAPSFDCGKARTSVEHAICGDVALARHDRELHASYAAHLRYAQPAKKEPLRQAQHAWLQKRDASCGSAPAATIVGCLDGLYRERLATLEGP